MAYLSHFLMTHGPVETTGEMRGNARYFHSRCFFFFCVYFSGRCPFASWRFEGKIPGLSCLFDLVGRECRASSSVAYLVAVCCIDALNPPLGSLVKNHDRVGWFSGHDGEPVTILCVFACVDFVNYISDTIYQRWLFDSHARILRSR